MRRNSFVGMWPAGSKFPRTSPAMRVTNPSVSNRVIGPMPERPACKASQFASTPLPRHVTIPIPVMTTLCCKLSSKAPELFSQPLSRSLLVLAYKIGHILNRLDLFHFFVGDFQTKLIFEEGNHVVDVQRFSAQIFHDLGTHFDVVLVDVNQYLG